MRLATRTRILTRSTLCSFLLLAASGCGESSKKESASSEKKAGRSAEDVAATPSEPPENKAPSTKEAEDVAAAVLGIDAAVVEPKAVTPPDASLAAKEPKDPPELIELWFKSAPSGATVHRVTNGKATFMGFTPFRLELEKRDVSERFEFRKKGYEVAASSHHMGKGGTIEVALEAAGRAAPAAAGAHDAGRGEPRR